MDKYICDCCGGQFDISTMKCPYCGTQYKKDDDHIIRIETFRNPVKTFSACVEVTDKEGLDYALNVLSKELAKAIPSVMEVRTEYDPRSMTNRVSGRIKVVQPVNVSDI